MIHFPTATLEELANEHAFFARDEKEHATYALVEINQVVHVYRHKEDTNLFDYQMSWRR